MLSRQTSAQLKGIAIILIIIGHTFQYYNFESFQMRFGAWGVSLFLILSGYGLIQSYKSKGLHHFLSKRLKRVWLPYIIVIAVSLMYGLLFLSESIGGGTYIKILLGMDLTRSFLPNYWFIAFILIWYVVFYIVFKFFKKDGTKAGILLFFAFILYIGLTPIIFGGNINRGVSYQFALHALSFPIGVLLGIYGNNFFQKLHEKIILYYTKIFTVTALIIFISSYVYLQINKISNPEIFLFVHRIEGISFSFMAIGLFMLIYYKGFQFKVLAFIGLISYELYLIHIVFLRKIKILDLFDNRLVAVLFFIITIILLSFLLNKISAKITLRNVNKGKVIKERQ